MKTTLAFAKQKHQYRICRMIFSVIIYMLYRYYRMISSNMMQLQISIGVFRITYSGCWRIRELGCQDQPTYTLTTLYVYNELGYGLFCVNFHQNEEKAESVSQPARIVRDQLRAYLALPDEPNEDGFDIMTWWNRNATTLPDVLYGPAVLRMPSHHCGCGTSFQCSWEDGRRLALEHC